MCILMRMDIEPLLTIAEVQHLLKVSRASVYKLIDAGEIRRIKLTPKAARITGESLRDYIERRTAA